MPKEEFMKSYLDKFRKTHADNFKETQDEIRSKFKKIFKNNLEKEQEHYLNNNEPIVDKKNFEIEILEN